MLVLACFAVDAASELLDVSCDHILMELFVRKNDGCIFCFKTIEDEQWQEYVFAASCVEECWFFGERDLHLAKCCVRCAVFFVKADLKQSSSFEVPQWVLCEWLDMIIHGKQ